MPQITEQQIAEIKTALKYSKLEAIKIYKTNSGDSLLESMKFVELLPDTNGPLSDTAMVDSALTVEQMYQLLNALGTGQKVEACKCYRDFSGLTLKGANDFVEKFADELHLDLSTGS